MLHHYFTSLHNSHLSKLRYNFHVNCAIVMHLLLFGMSVGKCIEHEYICTMKSASELRKDEIEKLHFMGVINETEYKMLCDALKNKDCTVRFKQVQGKDSFSYTWWIELTKVIE